MGYKEVLKVIAGAALWDFLVAVWFLFWGTKPVTFFWITFNTTGLIVVAAVDLVIVVVLSILAWSKKNSEMPKAPSASTGDTPSVQAVKAPASAKPVPAK